MFAKISRIFLYVSLLAPLVVLRSSFFPFIFGKTITFRILIELALLCFLCHALIEVGAGGQRGAQLLAYLKLKLKQPIVIAAIVFGIVFVISALTGVNWQQSLWSNFERGDGAFQLLHYVVFFILAVLLFPDRKSFRGFLAANIGVSVITCVYALAQLILSDAKNSGFILAVGVRVSGTFGNPSYLAAYLLINLAIIVYFFLRTKDVWWRTILAVIFAFETYILLNTGTRGAFLGLVIGLILLCGINLFITKNQKLKMWLGVGLAVVLGLPILFFATRSAAVWNHVPILNRLVNYESAVSDIQPRVWTWTSAAESVKDRPILGYGAENFPYPFDAYYNPKHYGIESFFDRTHNIFLEYLVAGGILLLLAWLSIFYFYYRRLMKQPKDLLWSIMFVVPIMYLCQGFFLFDTLPIYIIFFLFLAFSLSEESAPPVPGLNEPLQIGLPQLITVIVLTAGAAASLYYTDYLPARKNYLLTQALILQNTFTSEVGQGAKNITVNPEQIITAFETSLNFNSPVGQEETIGMFQKFVIYIVDTLATNPEVTKNPEYIKEIRSLVDKDNSWYDNNLKIFPGIKEAYLNGGINLRMGINFKQPDLLARGKQTYATALAGAPNRLELIKILIEVARLEKDQATFNALTAKAKTLRPDLDWQ